MKKSCNNALLSSAVDIGIRYSYSHVYNVGVGYLRNTQCFWFRSTVVRTTQYAVRADTHGKKRHSQVPPGAPQPVSSL